MLYRMHRDKSGPAIKQLDFMAVTIVEKTEGDSILYNMYDYDGRSVVLVRDKSRFKGDLNSAYGMLSEGDSATFKINADSLAIVEGKSRAASSKDKYLVYTIKVNKVIPRGSLTDSQMNTRIEAYRTTELEQAKATEAKKISNYIAANKLKPEITPSGLQYIITRKGTGSPASPGDSLWVEYTGRYLSGKVFYTTVPEIAKMVGLYRPGATYGPALVIPEAKSDMPYSALQEASLMFPKGTKATLIFSSKLGYDNSLRGVVAYAPLTSEIEIVDIKSADHGGNNNTFSKVARDGF